MSKVQFNLLPDVKLDYIRTEHLRKTVMSSAVIVSAVALAIFILLLFTVDVVQKQQMKSADAKVVEASKKLQSVPNISDVLTVQNQLNSLVALHQSKHIDSRIFDYLSQATPVNVSITKLDLDTASNTLSITGTADSHQTVNAFIDTLKLTTYTIGSSTAKNAFPSVIESSFSISTGNASFSLNIEFDPQLFSNNLIDSSGKPQSPKLTVPSSASARAQTGTSDQLFKGGSR